MAELLCELLDITKQLHYQPEIWLHCFSKGSCGSKFQQGTFALGVWSGHVLIT